MEVRCGQCIGCRLERSRQWAVRIMHEAQMHRENSFLTLTYADEHLPEHGSLDRRAFPLFMKRLRKEFSDSKIRYFHCGEYGENLGRPHYHAAIFGTGFPDCVQWTVRGDYPTFRSRTLRRLWPYGFHEIGSLTFESAQYVARYILEKVTGDAAQEHYERVDEATGEVVQLEPEYVTMSLRPGIGATWFEAYKSDVFPADEVVSNGVARKPPRYYMTLLERSDPEMAKQVKRARREEFDRPEPHRLEAQEVCTEARLSLTSRSFDEECV